MNNVKVLKIEKYTFKELFETKFDYIITYFNSFINHSIKLKDSRWVKITNLNLKIDDVDDIYEIDFDNNTFALWYGSSSIFTISVGMKEICKLRIGDLIPYHKIGYTVHTRKI